MGETDWGGNWVLFSWVGPCSVNLSSSFLLMGGTVSLPAIYLGWNYGEGNEDNGNLLQKILCYTQCPQPCSRLPPTHASAGDSWTLLGESGSVSCGVSTPFFWVLVRTSSVCAHHESISQSCVSSSSSVVGLMETSSKKAYAIPRFAAPKALDPAAVHCWPVPPQEMLKHNLNFVFWQT